ncbi:pro-interleukin-16 [Elysia marginata]|uniref:Pro-interleukin-16 n=1 Tax=Elysia marginata TaxID=1093978 RepID=A0AAV4ECS7_9GAST|nr:pro-interleukin-16 [Elysia marginata]
MSEKCDHTISVSVAARWSEDQHVKRLLPGGACFESGCLEVHDRLLYCNGLSLKGLTQAQCLQVLKSSGHFVELTVLRQIDDNPGQNASSTTDVAVTDSLDDSTSLPVSNTGFAVEAALHEEVNNTDHSPLEANIESSNFVSTFLSAQVTGGISAASSLPHEQNEQYKNIASALVSEKEKPIYEENEGSNQGEYDYRNVHFLNESPREENKPDTLINAIIDFAKDTEEVEETVDSDSEDLERGTNANPTLEGSSVIPPPLEFSDGSKGTESAHSYYEGFEECVTNIDDILFDVKESCESDNNSFNNWLSQEHNGREQQTLLSDDFTGSTVEEFAEQCFNNIENYTTSEGDLSSENEQNDSVLVAADELKTTLSDSSSINLISSQTAQKELPQEETKQHISTVLVSTFSHSESSNPANVTNIIVSSSDSLAAHNTVAPNDENFACTELRPDVNEEKDVCHESLASTEIIELFLPCLPSSAMMSSEAPPDSATHTTMGVVTQGNDAQDEEFIQPMTALKNAQGKVFVVKKDQDSVNAPGSFIQKDEEIAKKLAGVLETVRLTPEPQNTPRAEEAIAQEPQVEEEIVPTKLDRAQKESVLHALNKWTGNTDESKDKISLQDVVAHFKRDKIAPPENASTVHTIGMAATGSDDDMIQPMCVTRDHQGKAYCVPVSLQEVQKSESRAVDEKDREELVSITAAMAKLATPPVLDTADATDRNLAEEEHVIPATRKINQQHIIDGVLDTVRRKENKLDTGEKADGVNENDVAEKPRHHDVSDHQLVNAESVIELTHGNADIGSVEDVKSSQNGLVVDGEEIVRASSVVSVQCAAKQPSGDVNSVLVQDSVASPTENKKSQGFLSAVRTFENTGKEQVARQLPTALKPKVKESADVQSVVSKFEKPENITNQNEQVVLRPKTSRTSDFRAKIESFQAQEDAAAAASKTFVSSARPRSMIEVSSSSSGRAPLSKIDEIRKSFSTEPRLNTSLRPLSSITPLGGTGVATRRISTGSRAFSGGMFSGTRSPRANLPHSRQEDGSPFQVDVLKGILGLGLKVKVTSEGKVKVIDIQKGGPIEKDGHIRVGDFVTSINSTEVTGQNEVRVQQIIRLLPRGLVKLVVHSARPDTGGSSTAPPDGSEVDNNVDGGHSSQVSDIIVAPTAQASTHTFVLSGNKVEHVSSSNDQSSAAEAKGLSVAASSSESDDTSLAQPPLTARVEISSNAANCSSKQPAAPLVIAIKPTPTPRPAHPMTKALAPRSPNLPVTVEKAESPKEKTISASCEGEDVLRPTQRVSVVDKTSSQSDARRSLTSASSRYASGVTSFKNNRDMFEQKSSTTDVEIQKPKSNLNVDPTSTPIKSSEQVSRPAAATSSKDHVDFPPKTKDDSASLLLEEQASAESGSEKRQEFGENDAYHSQTEVQETITPLVSAKVNAQLPKVDAKEPSNSPAQKTPPPVAPKPRLSSSSSTKSDSFEESEDVSKSKPGPKISSGYERLQAITRSSKPSKILEKSRAFVSSKAKMFDAKTEEAGPASPEGVGRRISVGGFGQQDSSTGSINTSLKPISERRKSTGSGLITKPLSLTQQFSAAPKPNARTLTTARRPTEISIPETSPRDNISPDSKVKTVMSPTRLNSALSPRRASSTDSPLSPALAFSPRQVTSPRERKSAFIGDKYSSTSPRTKDQTGTFNYSSVTLHEAESPIKSSQKPSPPSQSHHQQTSSHSSTSITSPASAHHSSTPSLTSQVSEEHLENTMKMFDDLLVDAPIVHSESDPVDLLLWAPVRMDSPRSPSSGSQAHTDKTDQSLRKAPVAKPRSKPVEETLKPTDAKLNDTAIDIPKDEAFCVHASSVSKDQSTDGGNSPLQVSDTPKQQLELKQATNVTYLLGSSSKNDAESSVSTQISESTMNITIPKEKQSVRIHRILSNHSDDGMKDNLVAAQVSEAMNEDRFNKKKQDCDVHNMLASVSEKDIENNIVASDIYNSISENSRSKQKQNVDTGALLCDPYKTGDNIIAMQISEYLEKDFKGTNNNKSTENLSDVLSSNTGDNIVADNLSKEIAVDVNHANERNQEDVVDEVCVQQNTETSQSYPAYLTNGDNDDGVYREHAQKIVEGVLAKVTSEPTVNNKPENVQPDAGEEEEEPPPLPGAPPPPLILRNPVMLVSEQDLFDQGGVPVVPEGFSSSAYHQVAPNSADAPAISQAFKQGDNSQAVVDNTDLVSFETPSSEFQMASSRSPSTEMVSTSYSMEPLNSTSGSVSEGESHRMANSRSPDDMLSEDSGMPADEEFQEGATDDAMSPPGELAETEFALRSVNSAMLSSPPSGPLEDQSHVGEGQDKPALVLESNDHQTIPVIEVCDTHEDLPPPLPTTSLPPLNVQPLPELDVSLPQTTGKDSSSLLSSNEKISHGDERAYTLLETKDSSNATEVPVVIEEEKFNCVQEIPVSHSQHITDNTCEQDNVSSNELVSEVGVDKTSDVTDQSSNLQNRGKESVSSEEADSEGVPCLTSRRKWCFRSNALKISPPLEGDAGASTTLTYTDPSLTSIVSPSDLTSLLEKTNAVLDNAAGSADLELRVVHLCRQAESRDLGVDLKHDGGIWFRISRLIEGSPAKLEGGIEVGDWLLALDSLWCDQVTVMRLLARLTKPKRDSLLVVARGERSLGANQDQISSAQVPHRPTPAPRPRSAVQPVSGELQPAGASGRDEEPTTRCVLAASAPELPVTPSPLDIILDSTPPAETQDSPRGPVVYSATVTAELQASTVSPDASQQSVQSQRQEEASSLAAGEAPSSGIFKVVMMKGATGVGFCLEGGKGSPKGDVPIIIKRIFKGGPAEKCGQLKVKDEILEVNGVDFQSMRHYEAWNHLKFLDDGEVCITVRRE